MKKLALFICCINLMFCCQRLKAQAPVADFVLSDSIAGFTDNIECTDLSSGYPYSFQWSLNPPYYLINTYQNFSIQNTWNSKIYENPTIYLYDAGSFDVCLKVSNSIGDDSICKHAALKVINGYSMCNGSDSLSTISEGFLYDQGGANGNYTSLTTGSCNKGFHLSPCADSVMLYIKRFRLASGDTLIIRKNGPSGSIIKSLTGNNLANNLKTYRIAGNVFFQMHTHSGSQDSGFVIYWKTISGGVGYKINNLTQCINRNNFIFTDTSNFKSGISSRLWNFGTGNLDTSTSINPSKSYTNSSTYSVKLVVTNNSGCKDSVLQNIIIYPQPNVMFVQNKFNDCLRGNDLYLLDFSSITSGTISGHWFLGDGTDTVITILHKTFANAGIYSIKLIETSDHNCIDSAYNTFTVYLQPIVGFTQNSFVQCLSGNDFVLNDTSFISSGTMTRLWNFGDGNASTLNVINESYNNDGTYSIKLHSTTNFGCEDSIQKIIKVYPQPSASFIVDDSIQCLNENNFLLTDNSVVQSGTCNRIWNLGDATTNTNVSFNKSYSKTGAYNIQLKIMEQGNCSDSATHSILVKQNPVKPQTELVPNILIQATLTDNKYTWFLDTDSISNPYKGQTLYIHKNGTYYIKVDSTNGCSNSSDPIKVNLFSGAQALVYPNPNDGNFIIDFIDISGLKNVEVYDMLKKFITSFSTYDNMIEVDANHILASGMYLLRVETLGGTFVAKVVIE
jgi:PKD repeat protein